MTTRAQLRAREELRPGEADDIFELAARLQVADRAFDPARRPLGESRALDDQLDVAEHFIAEARLRISRRAVAASSAQTRPTPPSKWPLVLLALVVAGLAGLLTTVIIGRDRVHRSQRGAERAERSLAAELRQQVDRASTVAAFAGAASGRVDPLRDAAIDAPDVPERLVAVGILGKEMQRVLQEMPSPTTEERTRLHGSLSQQVRDSRRRIDTTARDWRDANSEWNAVSDSGPGKLAVLLELAEPPPGPRRAIPRP